MARGVKSRYTCAVEEPCKPGVVYLVGAGPGDPGLITVRGMELLSLAQVCVYDGLVNVALLRYAHKTCELIYGGKKHSRSGAPLTQPQISELLVDRARAGKVVVRLKGGDPFLFGRGGEECVALRQAGIPFEVVPGVSAATAVAAYAGIPLTMRNVSSTVAFATGHEAFGKPSTDIQWKSLAGIGTIVLFMAVKTAEECANHLMDAGRSHDTPAAAIYWGTTSGQKTLVTTLGQLGARMRQEQLKPPSLVIVGEVVGLRRHLSWYESRPMFGKRILITRSELQSRQLAKMLSTLGAEPFVCPMTQIVSPQGQALTRLHSTIACLDAYDWLVFASANAVRSFFSTVRSCRLDMRALAGVKIAVVGPATAAAVEQLGLIPDLLPKERRDAEALGKALCRELGAEIASTNILFPRAAHGRDNAIQMLRQAGAKVDAVTVYVTEFASVSSPTIAKGLQFLRRGVVDGVLVFAPSQVRALCSLLGDQAANILSSCGVVGAVGTTTAAALQEAGVRVDFIPSQPTTYDMCQELVASFQHRQEER